MPQIQKTLELHFLFSLVLCRCTNSRDQRDHLCPSTFSYHENKTSRPCTERPHAWKDLECYIFFSPGFSIRENKNTGHIVPVMFWENPLESVCKSVFCALVAGSVGRNLANKPNVYVSSSAGARWKEVSSQSGADNNEAESQAAPLSEKDLNTSLQIISPSLFMRAPSLLTFQRFSCKKRFRYG